MSTKRLQKQLIRDLKSSPKKAAILGLLVLVALYFWAPLLFGRRKSTEEPIPAVNNTSSANPASSAASMPSNDSAGQPVATWRELAAMIAADGRMSPSVLTNWNDAPLGAVEESNETKEESSPQETPDEPPPAITPASVGLELTGTVVGGRRRVAIINGRPYAEGRSIELPGAIIFRVVEVAHKRSILERGNERFLLEVETAVSPGDLAGELVSPQ